MSARAFTIRLFCVILLFHIKTNTMPNFLFLFRRSPNPVKASPEEMQVIMQKWMSWVSDLKATGVYKAGEPLMPTGKTLHKDNVITDGPFAEGKELVGGFFIVDAPDIDAAIEMAKACPDLERGGTVEVRDVAKM